MPIEADQLLRLLPASRPRAGARRTKRFAIRICPAARLEYLPPVGFPPARARPTKRFAIRIRRAPPAGLMTRAPPLACRPPARAPARPPARAEKIRDLSRAGTRAG